MKSIPYVPDLAMQQKLLKQLYRVEEVTTAVQVTDLSDLKEQKKEEEEKKAEEEKIEKVETKRAERAKMTDAEKKSQRAERRKSREDRAANLKKQVQQMSVFSAAGSKSGGGGIGRKSGKDGSGRKFSNIAGSNRGIAGGGASLGGGKKLVTGGAIADESADIEIVEGGGADIEGGELGGGLEMEEIEEVKGEGAESSLRTPTALNEVFKAQQAAISRCFERYKKRDPQLNGRLTISMTIMPGGNVERVSIQSQWSNLTLGGQVDDCIRKRVERWRFDPIEKGDVKIELPMSFY